MGDKLKESWLCLHNSAACRVVRAPRGCRAHSRLASEQGNQDNSRIHAVKRSKVTAIDFGAVQFEDVSERVPSCAVKWLPGGARNLSLGSVQMGARNPG